jgi:hypothetical protein
MLQLALQSYHDTYGSFPPAYVANANGKPIHSWRALLLPFIVENYGKKPYDLSQPWDGPKNRWWVHGPPLDFYQCPCRRHPKGSSTTDYVVVVGKDTMFPGAQSRSRKDVSDGVENTILVVEIDNSDICWAEPRDLQFDEMSFVINDPSRPSISSRHPGGPYVALAVEPGAKDLASRTVTLKSVGPETVRALLTANGGERVVVKDLLRGRCLIEKIRSKD